jgi:NAD(P)-dependent dehydrogenase (short-subunit alcohol dehydrogenase family)
MMDFTGQHVVITGGSTGIGRATAEIIAANGGKVTLIARRPTVLAEAAAAIGPAALAIACDVGDKPRLLAALDQAAAQNGAIDGLFLNAAAEGMYGLTSDYTDEAFEIALRINVWSPFWALRHVLPGMISRGKGAVLLTGTLGAVRGMAGNMGYCVSKHATLGLARTVAMEVAASGIRCNCLHPGFIDTAMMNAAPAEAVSAMVATTPQGRIGRPEEAGAVAAFLLSDLASHVTGQELAVDGGVLGTLAIR